MESSKEKILDAAKKLFAQKGYDNSSLAEISKLAGVNKALPYYYFESKQEILSEIVNRDRFLSGIPMVIFAVIHDKWAKYYGYDQRK